MTSSQAVAAAAASATPNAAATAAPAGASPAAAAAAQSGAPAANAPAATAPAADKGSLLSDDGKLPAGEVKADPSADGKPAPKAGEQGAPAAEAPLVFKLPEGIQADPVIMGEFQKTLKEAGITDVAVGQKFVDMFQAKIAPMIEAAHKAPQQAWDTLNAQWQNEVKADPEIGGKNWDATKANVAKAIDAIGGQDAAAIRQALTMTGAGNNPVLVKFMARMAKQLSESGQLKGGNAPSAPKNAAHLLYPNQGKE